MENWTVKSVDGEEVKSAQEQEQAVVEAATADNDNIVIENKDDVVKVNLDELKEQVQEDAVQEQETTEVSMEQSSGDSEEVVEEIQEPAEEDSPLELIQDEVPEVSSGDEAQVQEALAAEPKEEIKQVQLPENIEKLMKFMDETGGSLEDYIGLNKNYDDMHPVDVLHEYYKQTKPHLAADEIDFLMNDKFHYDEAEDAIQVKKKQLAFKEELFEAKKYLEGNKSKYYADLKSGSKLTPEAQEAVSFYDEYNKSQEANQKLAEAFKKSTSSYFNDEFKGFDFKVGDNKYRFKVSDVAKTKDYQMDLNNLIGDFAGKDGNIEDVAGYHKAIFAAKNADKIAQHFYEQGRSDALKQSAKESKNIDMKPRGDAASVVHTKSGTQVRVVSGQSSNGLKFKMRK